MEMSLMHRLSCFLFKGTLSKHSCSFFIIPLTSSSLHELLNSLLRIVCDHASSREKNYYRGGHSTRILCSSGDKNTNKGELNIGQGCWTFPADLDRH